MNNLVVTGFMGTGKTAVGELVARRLGRPFVDMDAEIERRARKPIARIFADEGEQSFRDMESELCLELSAREELVIATGGGALVDPANRTTMMAGSNVVCLSCGPEEILRRLTEQGEAQGIEERPLLHVADPAAEIEGLLEAREDAYAAIPWQIDTTGRTTEEVAAQVERVASFLTLSVHYPGGDYPVHIGHSALDLLGGAARAAGVPQGSRIAVVSNPVVAPLYGDRALQSLESAGFDPFPCSMPDGEEHKTLATVSGLYEQFLEGKLDRSGTVLSLGGGVTGDVAGFAAASFMRGVRLVQVPTTLLAMVDASVGGKTGVDLPQGKNLVGAFKQPVLVLIDPAVLKTLPAEEIRCGLAEVIKHGVIGDPALLDELEGMGGQLSLLWGGEGANGGAATAAAAATARLARALRVKLAIVEDDPYEQGPRALLNLGHTVAHGLERLTKYALRHGEAVSIGMVAAAMVASALGRAESSVPDRIRSVLDSWGLPVSCPPEAVADIWSAMEHDKKRAGRRMRWVLPRAIGKVEICDEVPPEVVGSVLRQLGAKGD
jgi:shikimate kinase/3-dehydroquinate synthase